MELHGRSIIRGQASIDSQGEVFRGFNPAIGRQLDPLFYEATGSEIERAFALSESASDSLRQRSAEEVARFLEAIGRNIVDLDDLIERTSAETGLPAQRLTGERARTVNQLQQFAEVVREGSWLEATIDRAQPDRKPLPKPDVRRLLVPIGPVVVFGASNFPLAFSVAGGDTVSALAAGNPVIVKAHPAHPGTSEMVARAIVSAVEEMGLPAGVFSLLQGTSHELSLSLVRHPKACAVGFTGSLQAGRAIYDAAAQRPDPIPVYAEMGSSNPVFVLPNAMREKGRAFAEGLQQSVTLGVGQFCTCPGLVVGLRDEATNSFIEEIERLFEASVPATMLHPGILRAYQDKLRGVSGIHGIKMRRAAAVADETKTEAGPAVFVTDGETFLRSEQLGEEVFGPATLIVTCSSREEMMNLAGSLHGHLTATIHGTTADMTQSKDLIDLLQKKVGRLIYNGFPTGVEVCAAMHHGGPYPATTDSRSTSVGTAAIKRFARPICFQNFPQESLPLELKDKNLRGIWRMIDGQLTRDDC
ncbi:MAG: aldehyde dehydrogenase (NADP(+)) [Pyrinomonadaceae bacterium]